MGDATIPAELTADYVRTVMCAKMGWRLDYWDSLDRWEMQRTWEILRLLPD
jgi:hypothetical protein